MRRILHLHIHIYEFLEEWLQTVQRQLQKTKPQPTLQRLCNGAK